MDDLLQEFLTESHEHLDTVDRQMVEFESNPSNSEILRNIFRLVHTIKGTCGFLGLPRLEALAHSAETLLGQLRDGVEVTANAVTLTLASLDRIKVILAGLEETGAEPAGSDADLISALDALTDAVKPAPPPGTVGSLTYQVLERPLKAGEASLDDLERAFRDADGPETDTGVDNDLPPDSVAGFATPSRNDRLIDDPAESRLAAQTIRVQVGTLEHLMTMVSELVLTRNQLLEIARRENDQSFKLPLQRLSHITAELQDGVMKTRMQPIGNAWNKLPRVVRDLAAELGKKIELVMEGADTELDRQVLEQIKDPLTHMVRNSADHGVELPGERLGAGKPETGRIRLSAVHEGGSITIRVSDDGKGLDIPRIRKKAREAGLASPAELDKMTDAQVARFSSMPVFRQPPRSPMFRGEALAWTSSSPTSIPSAAPSTSPGNPDAAQRSW
jgi:two-component system, chemotaxis family, sensor kinase CheA